MPTDFTYTGQRSETASFGLMYYGARWYDPALGRFTQADTVIPGAGNPMAWDRFGYVSNNPLRYTDSTGHVLDAGCETVGCGSDLSTIIEDPPFDETLGGNYGVEEKEGGDGSDGKDIGEDTCNVTELVSGSGLIIVVDVITIVVLISQISRGVGLIAVVETVEVFDYIVKPANIIGAVLIFDSNCINLT
jgi:RHS repeat-associated protein